MADNRIGIGCVLAAEGSAWPNDDHLEARSREFDIELIIDTTEENIHPSASGDKNTVLVQQYISLAILFDFERKEVAFTLVDAKPVTDREELVRQAVPVNEYPVAIVIEQDDILSSA